MKRPLVSIIIPCHNQGQYLQEAVYSVLASTYENIEIIVVNDGSTENTELLEKFCAPKTKIIHQIHQGVSAARNNAIKESCGEYILPLDADDKIHPQYIEKAVNILKTQRDTGIVYCEAEFFGTKKGKWKLKKYKFPNVLWRNVIFSSAMYRKSDWEKAGGYKNEMDCAFEDWEFWITLIENGAGVYQIPETLFYYRKNASSRSKNAQRKKIEMINQIIKFHRNLYAKHWKEILFPMLTTFFKLILSAKNN